MALPQNSEQDSGDNSSTNQGSGTGHGQESPKGFFSADALEVSGGLILLVVGAAFHYAGGWFHIVGFFCDFLVVCCGLTVFTHHVEKEKFELFGLRYWVALMVAFIIFASLAVYVVRKETSLAPPTNTDDSKPATVQWDTNALNDEIAGVIAKSIANLNKTESATNFSDLRFDGYSANMIIRLVKPVDGRDNYLFDFGQNWEKNRISLYIDTEQNLCFRVIDEDSQPMVIKAKSALETFNFGNLCFLTCEYGTTNNFSFVRLFVNGTQVAEKHQDSPIIFSIPLSEMLFVLGSDLSKENGGVFDLRDYFAYSKTLNSRAEIYLLNYADSRARAKIKNYVSFSGSNWFECIGGRGTLYNTNMETVPKSKIE
jgi:hypothetical protein